MLFLAFCCVFLVEPRWFPNVAGQPNMPRFASLGPCPAEGGPAQGGPAWEPTIFRFLFLGCPCGFAVVSEGRAPQNGCLGPLGSSCETPAASPHFYLLFFKT